MMKMTSIQAELDTLFSEWKCHYVSQDGILDENKYWSSMPRIVFSLKEMYDDTYIDNKVAPLVEPYLNGYGPEGSSHNFWRNMRTWQYTIEQRVLQAQGKSSQADVDLLLTLEKLNKIKETPVIGVGYVNIKKIVGKNTSSWDDIYNYARNDACLLKRQLDLMEPHVVFCCGNEADKNSVLECFKIIYTDFDSSSRKINNAFHIYNDILVIDWWHPSARGTYFTWDKLDTEEYLKDSRLLSEINQLNWTTKGGTP